MIKALVPEEVTDALSAIGPDRNFNIFKDWLAKSLDDSRKENDEIEGISLTRNQGCCITLTKILKAIEKAG
jgi:hypothetical protein